LILAISALNPQHYARASLELVAHPLNWYFVASRTQDLQTPFQIGNNHTTQGKNVQVPALNKAGRIVSQESLHGSHAALAELLERCDGFQNKLTTILSSRIDHLPINCGNARLDIGCVECKDWIA
jgi:hypothetical protein